VVARPSTSSLPVVPFAGSGFEPTLPVAGMAYLSSTDDTIAAPPNTASQLQYSNPQCTNMSGVTPPNRILSSPSTMRFWKVSTTSEPCHFHSRMTSRFTINNRKIEIRKTKRRSPACAEPRPENQQQLNSDCDRRHRRCHRRNRRHHRRRRRNHGDHHRHRRPARVLHAAWQR
jgi:hypothetical protein